MAAGWEVYPLNSEHPWRTVICPIVAVEGEKVTAIGAGFTFATFGVVVTPGVVPVAALNRSTQIGSVFGVGVEGGRNVGVFVPIAQVRVRR